MQRVAGRTLGPRQGGTGRRSTAFGWMLALSLLAAGAQAAMPSAPGAAASAEPGARRITAADAPSGGVATASAPSAAALATAAAAAPSVASVAASAPPLYRTRIPPPVVLHYVMQRGFLRGSGALEWRPSGSSYTLQLDGGIAGLRILHQASEGGLDAAGLAPRRFSDQRLRGEMRVANFDRDIGRITFSDSPQQLPLLRGTQDRLSWMIQLAAIFSADPTRLVPGAQVAFAVVGARADPAIWTLRFVGPEDVQTDGGTVHAIKFERVGEAGDNGVEVWLDPQHDYLPIRASLHSPDSGAALELTLKSMVFERR